MSADFKQTLWKAADKLRAQMDAAEYKHIVLGLIFLKYISDTFYPTKLTDSSRTLISILNTMSQGQSMYFGSSGKKMPTDNDDVYLVPVMPKSFLHRKIETQN